MKMNNSIFLPEDDLQSIRDKLNNIYRSLNHIKIDSFIRKNMNIDNIYEGTAEDIAENLDIPKEFVEFVIDDFLELGIITRTEKGFKLKNYVFC